MNRETAAAFIRENFEATDRLAIVLINRRTGTVTQRIASAEKVASPEFQAWLRSCNGRHCEVYISMNALQPQAKGRTKADVAVVRHVYLDFDDNGTAAIKDLLKRTDLPKPNYLVNSSPGKWQVLWKVEGFGKEQAENLQKALARSCGADPAATDCARVLRLPGFYNYKYGKPHLIGVESLAAATYHSVQFLVTAQDERYPQSGGMRRGRGKQTGITQSERDWAYAKRALARGEAPAIVAAAVASYRRYDKHNPQYYAELTVQKAVESLKAGPERAVAASVELDRT